MLCEIKSHILKKSHRANFPTCRLFLDTECDRVEEGGKVKLVFRLACTKFERIREAGRSDQIEYKVFTVQTEFWEYLASKLMDKRPMVVITHNADFDSIAAGIVQYLTLEGYQLSFYYSKGLMYLLSAANDKKKIMILSTTNYYPFALQKIGAMLKLPKLDVALFDCSEAELIVYCKRDVEIMYRAFKLWENTIKTERYGGLRLTKASQALSAYRSRFMDHNIYVHEDKEGKEIERKSYCGGRCEAFRIGRFGDETYAKLDFNSNYAYVMRKYQYPTRLLGILHEPTVADINYHLKSKAVCCEVELTTNEPAYPYKHSGMLLFPTGTFTTTLCTAGMQYAIQNNHLLSIKRACIYDKKPIFRDFVDHFVAKKIEAELSGNLIMRTIYKDIMNSLYGKFAEQHPVTRRTEPEHGVLCRKEIILYPNTSRKGQATTFLNSRWEEVGLEDTSHTFTAIASHVTEYARFLLWAIYKQVGRSNVLYSDTDSLILPSSSLSRITHPIHDTDLGALKLELEGQFVEIFAPKNYTMCQEQKRKGVPKSARLERDGSYTYESFEHTASCIRREDLNSVLIKTVHKRLSMNCRKGKLSESGEVIPFNLPDDSALLPV